MKKIGLQDARQKSKTHPSKASLCSEKHASRRKFLRNTSLLSLQLLLGAEIVHAALLPKHYIPVALHDGALPFSLPGKDPGLRILNDRPVNAETPPHLLNDNTTPSTLFFVRNNGLPPERSNINTKQWTLTIDGESAKKTHSFTIDELQSKFETVHLHLTLECGGNGRSEYNPPAKGNQWTTGAVGCAKWTGVRLKDVLNDVGVGNDAIYIGYYGADTHLSGDPNKDAISRGVPIDKAMQDESMIAWAMNDAPLPILNGFPLRLVFGGWPASCSGKWLERISIRNKVHDGVKMGGTAYRVPCETVAPGEKVPNEDMCIIESMPVKSLITYPKSGAMIKSSTAFNIKGHAWAGELEVDSISYSTDFGATWKECPISRPINKYAWQHFSTEITLEKKGYYEVWAKATDSEGRSQPMIVPGWNPKGYLNNACHRIAIKVI